MTAYTTYQIDAFTQTPFKGNPAGVVTNADGLTDIQMQQIARELNNSETAFIFPPRGNDCDGTIRYFTPTTEVPICGHATIAALFAKAGEENIQNGTFRMKTGVGILPVEIQTDDTGVKIWMTQGAFELQPPLPPQISNELLSALGLTPEEMDHRCPVQIASTGAGKVMIGIQSRESLNALKPDFPALVRLSKTIGCNGYYVFTFDSENPETLVHGRMFAPAVGINEDPVTGNANGPLGGYLIHNDLVGPQGEEFRFKAVQGEAMGREGMIEVVVGLKNGRPEQIKLAGQAVEVFKTRIEI